MKTIEVVAAIIQKDNLYFATQRGYGEFEGGWEFPGGKIEPGESAEQALQREIQEELGVDITVEKHITTVEYDYPSFHLILHCYLCQLASPHIELREHKAARWLSIDHLHTVEWLPADVEVVECLQRQMKDR